MGLITALLNAPFLWGATPSEINFTLSRNTGIDSGLSYNNHLTGDTAATDRFVVGFEIDINSVDGVEKTLDPIAAFCSEIEEPISTTTYTFDASPLRRLAAGTAGQSGTASSGMPPNGIGTPRAAQVRYFFDQYYTSVDLTGWSQIDLHAFQLGLWEITHDTDLDLSTNTGTNYLGSQTTGTAAEITFRDNALLQAQSWLDDVNTANVTPGYTSSLFKFWALVDDGQQDVVLATLMGSEQEKALSEFIVVPEPAFVILWSLPALLLLPITRRKAKRRVH